MEVAATTEKPRRWYNSYRFPLVTQLTVKEANKYNTGGFNFEWLFFRAWSLDSFNFEVGLVCSEHWGIGIIGIFPYLRWCICLLLPTKITRWFSELTYRKP